MSDVAILIRSRAQSGRRDELLALYEELLAPRAEANEAQTMVIWAADQHDDDVFHLVEIYTDPAAMEANAQAPWFGDYMAKAGPLLAAEPEVSLATPRWTKGAPGGR